MKWHEEQPPRHVVIIAEFKNHTEKVIYNGSQYWSEQGKQFINETPEKWRISKDYEQERKN